MNGDSTKNNSAIMHPVAWARHWLDSSIAHRITLFAFTFMILITGTIGWNAYQANRRLVEDEISNGLSNAAILGARQVESTLNRLFDDLERLSSNTMIESGLADPAARD